jgi:hypothetical protein
MKVVRSAAQHFSGGGGSELRIQTGMCLITEDLFADTIFAFSTNYCSKYKIINDLSVEAAGVEPEISIENTQLTDSENASNAENAMISKSAVQRLYKVCQEFPELQPSDLSPQMRSTLKSSCNIYTLVLSCMLFGSRETPVIAR